MTEIWESSFIEKQAMWGFEPADAAIVTLDFFKNEGIKDILIPGFGYGRNAQLFRDNGIAVTGIEISKTAIALARAHYGVDMNIYHGSVTHMPFDDKHYEGIFCFSLIHLLSLTDRRKFIRDCFNQLKEGGYMIFTAISQKAPMFGKGKQLSKNRFELFKGVKMFFYDVESVNQEFGKYGLTEIIEIDEPVKNMKLKPPLQFLLIKCRKEVPGETLK